MVEGDEKKVSKTVTDKIRQAGEAGYRTLYDANADYSFFAKFDRLEGQTTVLVDLNESEQKR